MGRTQEKGKMGKRRTKAGGRGMMWQRREWRGMRKRREREGNRRPFFEKSLGPPLRNVRQKKI